MVLLGVIALGLGYALSRAAVAQGQQKALSLSVQKVRALLQDSGIADGCLTTGTPNTINVTLSLGSSITAPTATKTCTITPVSVTIGANTQTTKLAMVSFSSSASTLQGPGTLVISNTN